MHVAVGDGTSLLNAKDGEDEGIVWIMFPWQYFWLLQPEHEFWWQGQRGNTCRGEGPCFVSVFQPLVDNQSVLLLRSKSYDLLQV